MASMGNDAFCLQFPLYLRTTIAIATRQGGLQPAPTILTPLAAIYMTGNELSKKAAKASLKSPYERRHFYKATEINKKIFQILRQRGAP